MFSGLSRYGCGVTENGDGSHRIAVAEPALQTASVGEVIERATFDPERALDDPDLTLLDVGYPLVRRLIEAVKQDAFRVGAHGGAPSLRYGRTAYVVTPDVDEVTAVYHLLARYVVNTEPTAIVEELLPVAVAVYGEGVLDGASVQRALEARPAAQTRTQVEVQEALADALAFPGLEQVLQSAVEGRRQALAAERRRMREQMERQQGGEAPGWLRGIDDLSPGSFDLLTVRVLYPG